MPPNDFDLRQEARAYQHRLLLWPRRWREYSELQTLKWEIFTFDEKFRDSVPAEPGVYAFLIQPRIACNLNVSYLTYVGKTERSLRTRFMEYTREAVNDIGRTHIIDMVKMYREGYLYFACAVVESGKMCRRVEDELVGAFIPPANKRLPANVRRIVPAFG